VDSGQLGPFANAYWGHSAYKLPPEANLMATPRITSKPCAAGQGRPHARHFRRQEPPSAIPGGRRYHLCPGLTPDRIAEFLYITKETQEFIKNVYIPDLLAVASFYKDWGGIGGTTNFLAWGEFPETDKPSRTAFTCRAA
jgi:[NiFe] hydrogenase large subunit